MHPKTRIALSMIGIICLFACLGYFREFLFVNINEQLRFLWYGNEESFMSEKLSFMQDWDYWTMYSLKWVLTVAFALIFMVCSAFALKAILNSFYWLELGFIYFLLFSISGIIFIGYSVFAVAEDGYLISRYFMGLAQSPIPLMILIPAIFLRKNLSDKV